MTTPVQVAVVGCGWAGVRHAQAWQRQGAALRWAVDTQPERAAAFSARRVAMAYHQALEDPAVAVVDICLPHHQHAPVAVAPPRRASTACARSPLPPPWPRPTR